MLLLWCRILNFINAVVCVCVYIRRTIDFRPLNSIIHHSSAFGNSRCVHGQRRERETSKIGNHLTYYYHQYPRPLIGLSVWFGGINKRTTTTIPLLQNARTSSSLSISLSPHLSITLNASDTHTAVPVSLIIHMNRRKSKTSIMNITFDDDDGQWYTEAERPNINSTMHNTPEHSM